MQLKQNLKKEKQKKKNRTLSRICLVSQRFSFVICITLSCLFSVSDSKIQILNWHYTLKNTGIIYSFLWQIADRAEVLVYKVSRYISDLFPSLSQSSIISLIFGDVMQGFIKSQFHIYWVQKWITSKILRINVTLIWKRKWQATPVFLPGEPHGQRSLVGYKSIGSQRVGHDWSNLACMLL